MTIQEFWAQAKTAVRFEILKFSGVPPIWIDLLSGQEWDVLSPLIVAMVERSWDAQEVHATAVSSA